MPQQQEQDPYQFQRDGLEKEKRKLIAELTKASEADPADKYPNAIRPAYPTNNRMFSAAQGLTKREYFAAMAMQGLVNREGWAERFNNEIADGSLVETLAIASVKMSDALLKQLEK